MNWPDLISSIQAAGLSQPQIAKECGCAQSTISDLSAGRTRDPRFSIGEALKALGERCAAAGGGVAKPNPPPALAGQAPAAINSDAAQEPAHA